MFTCPGDVAQLGERLGRIEEVEGSIPFVSTTGFWKGLGNGAFFLTYRPNAKRPSAVL